jgi:hypothetical protein
MRATQKNMELTLQTRRMALAKNIAHQTIDFKGMRIYFELNMYWKDYVDFEKRYGSDR